MSDKKDFLILINDLSKVCIDIGSAPFSTQDEIDKFHELRDEATLMRTRIYVLYDKRNEDDD